MIKRYFSFFIIINLLLLNTLHASEDFRPSEILKDRSCFKSIRGASFKTLFLAAAMIQTIALVPSISAQNCKSPDFLTTFESCPDPFSTMDTNQYNTLQYFSIHKPIPIKNRTTLYNDLEFAYRSGEACEEENIHMNILKPKKCNEINGVYKSPKKLKPIEILPAYKLVPQWKYAISSDQILFTAHLMKCVGIGIYNPIDERFGLVHVAGENIKYLDDYLLSDEESKTGFHEFIEEVAGEINPAELRVTMVSGSKAHLEYYRYFMEKFGIQDFTLIQKDDWGSSRNSYYNKNFSYGSLAVDPRNGQAYRIKNDKYVSKLMGPPVKLNIPLRLKRSK